MTAGSSVFAGLAASRVLAAPPIDRGTGRDWAERELSDPAYRDADVTPLARLGRAIRDFLERLWAPFDGLSSPWLVLLVVLALGLLVFLVVRRLRRGAGGGLDRELFTAAPLSAPADPHALRRSAETHASAGRFGAAVQDRFRAIMADLDAHGRIDVRTASTAHELAADAGLAVPEAAPGLSSAAAVFDEVTFADVPGTAETYATLTELDERVGVLGGYTRGSARRPAIETEGAS